MERRLGHRPEPPGAGDGPVLAETPGGRILPLAANCLDEPADVAEPGEAAAVDSLVHLAEASGLRWCSAGWGDETECCKSGDGSCGEDALHGASLLLWVRVHPTRALRAAACIGLVLMARRSRPPRRRTRTSAGLPAAPWPRHRGPPTRPTPSSRPSHAWGNSVSEGGLEPPPSNTRTSTSS